MAGEQSVFKMLDHVLGLGLWNKAVPGMESQAAAQAHRANKLWSGVKPERLGTLALLQDLRDAAARKTATWDPMNRYQNLSSEGYSSLGDDFDRLLDQLKPVEHLTPAEQDVIRGYQITPAEYRWGRDKIHPSLAGSGQEERDLYDLLQATELPVDMNTYRGFSVYPHGGSSADRSPLYTPPREGDVLGARGFMSTSVDPSSAWDFLAGGDRAQNYLADVYLPVGSRALPIRTGDSYDQERELLLSPGTRFRVAGDPEPFDESLGKIHRLRLEALHPDDPYQAPNKLRVTPPELSRLEEELLRAGGPSSDFLREHLPPPQPRGHYAKSGVYGYLAGLGPLAALATPGIMDLYSRNQEQQ